MEGDGGESKPPSSHVHHQQQQHVVVLEGGDVVDVDDNSEGRSDGDDKDDDDGKAATLSDAASGTLSRLSKMPLAGHAAILLACVLQTVTAVIIKAGGRTFCCTSHLLLTVDVVDVAYFAGLGQ